MNTHAILSQAVALHQSGRFVEAEKLYGQVLAAQPGNFQALYLHGLLLHQQKRQPEALAAIDAALQLNPNAPEALGLHGLLLRAAGQLDRALMSASKLTALAPTDADAWHSRGMILADMRRFDEALASYDKVLALKPAHTDALYRRGTALLELGRHQQAVAVFDDVLAREPNAFNVWINRGLALHEMGHFADSLASYERALKLRPDHAPAWTNHGKALNNLQRFDEALASYDRALAIDPRNLSAWQARATTLRTAYRFDEAIACVDTALAIYPGLASLLFLRGWLLCEQDRISDGLAVIRDAAVRDITTRAPEAAPAHKQRHDLEQRDYLAGRGVSLRDGELYFAGGERLSGPVINPANAETAAAQWKAARPQIAVIDAFLTPEALESLRRFCWGSTFWRKPYPNGYLGAMPEEQAFAAPLLAQIAEGLRDTFPGIIGDHRLRMLWGFKYDSALRGIEIHADQAAVNVNFWITPDEANANPASGGMVIWDVAAPQDWDARIYNGDDAAAREFLDRSGAKPRIVPYRANRAVIFDSDLFHKTDEIDFKDGYLNRRINLTLLYGRRTYYGR
ncbi:MAG: tetratricopeptide repeat protein [Rhodospirillaceae bacterium]|nr:tetratricopeptide repeat protein [Rhodospirillaceae bacterium]